MKARVTWVENNTFLGESNSGHAVVMNAATTPGGPTVAPSPMEYLLLGTGGCTSIDVVMIPRPNEQPQGAGARLRMPPGG